MSSIEEQAARQDLDSVSRLSFGPASARRSDMYATAPTVSYLADSVEPTATLQSQDLKHSDQLYRKDSIESNFTSVSQRRNPLAYSSSRVSPSGVSNRIALDLLTLAKDAYQQQLNNEFVYEKNEAEQVEFSSSMKFASQVEANILNSREPVEINERDEIEVLGERGIWANKAESLMWRGVMPLSEYAINNDPNPEVITKRSKRHVEYIQGIKLILV